MVNPNFPTSPTVIRLRYCLLSTVYCLLSTHLITTIASPYE
ncbi:MAG: hypothetical protein U9Q74_06245 [Gemmatimonadota bacterium]|nr:hypothetical protein [Gemmatimonadota bacterium]